MRTSTAIVAGVAILAVGGVGYYFIHGRVKQLQASNRTRNPGTKGNTTNPTDQLFSSLLALGTSALQAKISAPKSSAPPVGSTGYQNPATSSYDPNNVPAPDDTSYTEMMT